MGWIESKSIGAFLPVFTEEFVGGESAQGLEALSEVVSDHEVCQMGTELCMAWSDVLKLPYVSWPRV